MSWNWVLYSTEHPPPGLWINTLDLGTADDRENCLYCNTGEQHFTNVFLLDCWLIRKWNGYNWDTNQGYCKDEALSQAQAWCASNNKTFLGIQYAQGSFAAIYPYTATEIRVRMEDQYGSFLGYVDTYFNVAYNWYGLDYYNPILIYSNITL
jgi:hypothetical protein